MVTISNSDLPGYDPIKFREFMHVVTKEFRMPQEYQDAAEIYICRRWTAAEISAMITCDGIKIGKFNFMPLFSTKATLLYNEELVSPEAKENPKYFWLSFRAVRYPLGSKMDGTEGNKRLDAMKAYVLIQPDLRS